jgi:RHS repeat-associated protein
MTSITLTGTGKTYTLGYDDHGNLSTKTNAADGSETTSYTWDARNRLVSIQMSEGASTSTATFKYDALGRRTERVVDNGTTVQRTQFIYDGIQAIGELVDGRLSATMLTGLNIDEVIARTVNLQGGAPIDTKTYLTDALGSVLAMTNPAQNPELFYAYSAYGETSQLGADVNSPANSNQYTARENDGTVGGTNGGQVNYYRARYYDPVLKRFMAEDAAGLGAGLNLYAYVAGNPGRFTDPSGMFITSVDAACVQAPDLCAEIVGQIVQNAANLMQDCPQAEDANRVANTIRNIGAIAGIVSGIRGIAKLPIPKVKDPKLQKYVEELYKGAKADKPIGTGSTADAIRHELATGEQVGNKWHSQKGSDYITALERWQQNNPGASHYDRMVAESIKRDLQNALGR